MTARACLQQIAGPQEMGACLKSLWPRLAGQLNMSERRVRAIWHGEARQITDDEMGRLTDAARRAAAWRREIQAKMDDLEAVKERLADIDA